MHFLLVVVFLLATFGVIIAFRPSQFRVSRSLSMTVPAEVIFPHVATLRSWHAWSPWSAVDPSMKRTYDGPAVGQGASTNWYSQGRAGEGRMTIVEVITPKMIRLRAEFFKPRTRKLTHEFAFEPDSQGTTVSWTMYGAHNLVAKAFSLFINHDKLMGPDFEKGLLKLKNLVEGTLRQQPAPRVS